MEALSFIYSYIGPALWGLMPISVITLVLVLYVFYAVWAGNDISEWAEILLAHFPYVMIGDRTGLQISKSTEATLTQGTETPINLWEQDMTAYRFVVRKGFCVKDPEALSKITGVPQQC